MEVVGFSKWIHLGRHLDLIPGDRARIPAKDNEFQA